MATYFGKAVRSSNFFVITGISSGVIAYLIRVALAKNLKPEEFGLFYAALSLVIFFLFFRDLGLSTALIKYIAEFKSQNKLNEIKTSILCVFMIQFVSSAVISVVLFFSSEYLSKHYFKDPNAVIVLDLLIIYALSSALFTVIKNSFQGLQNMYLCASIELVKNVTILVTILILFWHGYGVFSPAIAFAIVSGILFLIYSPILLHKFNLFSYNISQPKEIAKKLIYFGIPTFATSVGGKIIGYIDTIMLTHYRSLGEVGIYNVVLDRKSVV